MNKLVTILFCLGFMTMVLSQDPSTTNGDDAILLENFEDLKIIDSILTSEEGVPDIFFVSAEEEAYLAEEGTVNEEEEVEEEFTDGIIIDPNDFLQPHEFEEIPPELVDEEEEEELGEFDAGILFNSEDDSIIGFEDEFGNELILEEELELGEFTDGIILGPDDFLEPHEFEEEPEGVEIIVEEEEDEEWQQEQGENTEVTFVEEEVFASRNFLA